MSHGPQLKSGNPGRLLGQASAGREEKPSLGAELAGNRGPLCTQGSHSCPPKPGGAGVLRKAATDLFLQPDG